MIRNTIGDISKVNFTLRSVHGRISGRAFLGELDGSVKIRDKGTCNVLCFGSILKVAIVNSIVLTVVTFLRNV